MTAPLVVIGDVMLDVDRSGSVGRLSPEVPVPVLHDVSDRRRPGGAALAALLAARSGTRPVTLIAPFADDDAARQIRELLGDTVRVLPLPWAGSTPVKTRLRAGGHPIARIDEGGDRGVIGALPADVGAALTSAAAVLVADYGVGATACPPLRELLEALGGRTPLVWDPHLRGSTPVAGTWWVTPNEAELTALTVDVQPVSSTIIAAHTVATLRRRAEALAARWPVRGVCVTVGGRGAMLFAGGNPALAVAPPAVTVGDTCGAGDSFAAAAAAAFADGAVPSEVVAAAVAGAARFVAAGGAAGFDAAQPMSGPADDRRPPVAELLARVRQLGGTVVATGGCFDLLHAGHVATLQAARALGDCLVVCLNSDASVRRLKGSGRPLQPELDRARVLAALECVDAVVIFDQDTPCTVLPDIRPDLWAKGGDYSGLDLPEAEVLAQWGGEVVTVPYLPGRSTTALVALAGSF